MDLVVELTFSGTKTYEDIPGLLHSLVEKKNHDWLISSPAEPDDFIEEGSVVSGH